MGSETRREPSFDLDRQMSSLSIDTSQSDSSTTEKKRRGGKSAESTWVHSRKAFPYEKNQNHKYCIHCLEGSDIYNTSVSSNMRGHLERHHDIIVETATSAIQEKVNKQLEQLYLRAETSNQTAEVDTRVLRKVLDGDRIHEAFVSLLVTANLSFRLVELPQFHTYNQSLNPEAASVVTTSHSHVATKIGQIWERRKKILKKKIQSALSNVHLSVDIWTSPNNLLLLAICAHFVDGDNKLVKALLGLREVENHSGEEQFIALLPVLQDYGIVRNIGAIIADNATTNDTLCRAVGRHLREEEQVDWDPVFQRVRCIGHTINLAVQTFLFQDIINTQQLAAYDREDQGGHVEDEAGRRRTVRGIGSLGKLHNIVTFIRGSPGRIKAFKKEAGRMIPLDNRTRWNSWYTMVQVALSLEGAIDVYTKANYDSLQSEFLEPEDWESLRKICAFLQPFHESTMKTQGDEATIDRVLFTMDILIEHFQLAVSYFPSKYKLLILINTTASGS